MIREVHHWIYTLKVCPIHNYKVFHCSTRYYIIIQRGTFTMSRVIISNTNVPFPFTISIILCLHLLQYIHFSPYSYYVKIRQREIFSHRKRHLPCRCLIFRILKINCRGRFINLNNVSPTYSYILATPKLRQCG